MDKNNGKVYEIKNDPYHDDIIMMMWCVNEEVLSKIGDTTFLPYPLVRGDL